MAHTHHNPIHYHTGNHDTGVDNEMAEIELQEGETICDKCEGTGRDPNHNHPWNWTNICPKCQGEKKLDWISRATGVAPKDPYSMPGLASSSGCGGYGPSHNHTIGYNSSLTSCKLAVSDNQLEIDGKPVKEYVAAIVAEELAKKIDEEIIEAYIAQREQTNKKRRKLFDNRIFSKLLFFCNFK